MFDLEVDGLPDRRLWRNTRGHWKTKIKHVKAERQRGYNYGIARRAQIMYENHHGEPGWHGPFPLRCDLVIEITIRHPARVDWENPSFKEFIDGLVDADVLEDDSQIKRAVIELEDGEEGFSLSLLPLS